MNDNPAFVPLHLHTEYAIHDALVRIPALCNKAKDYGFPAVALTDPGNLFALVKFYTKMMQAGIKPIIGCELWLESETTQEYVKIVVLCQNQAGYHNLCKILSKAYCQETTRKQIPIIQKAWVFEHQEGLIVLCGSTQGVIGQFLHLSDLTQAEKNLKEWMSVFKGRFYLELQRTHRPNEDAFNYLALQLAKTHKCPIVASNNTVFLDKTDFEAHEARVCIQEGWMLNQSNRPKNYTQEQYLKSANEMASLFSDVPQALANTVEIAKRCNVQLDLGKAFLPNFPVPKDMTVADYLVKAANEGLEKRFGLILAEIDKDDPALEAEKREQYRKRLQTELDVINAMGFAGYFLIVSDFMRWANGQNIPLGPGRGSGAGSLVAYVLEITGLDPIAYELLFERFLNPERVSMPDFDIDFCMEGRDRVIEYVAQKYGRQSVSQIATFGTMAAKAVIRDVGRILGLPYGFVDVIAKLVPFEIGMTLEKALEQEEALKERYDKEEEIRELIDLAMQLEGLIRNVGKHAGGVVIAPSKLTDFLPLYCEADTQQAVTQLDKDDVENIGLVKFDFLGLRTLTIIDWAIQNTEPFREKENLPPIDIAKIPLDDKKTFDLLKNCQTTAVFQLESRGMKELIHRLRPDEFEEIVALVALFRPGPLQSGMVDDFIDRKHGKAQVEYPHPAIEKILKPTYGVILYQEQVMQIAQVLAGYSLGGADLLRRAMGKKKVEEMAKQRAIFTEGAVARGVPEAQATYIFDLMEKFAGYGFNRSHSAAYAMLAYQTAWIKAHYPTCFMAAVLSSDMNNTDKLVNYIEDCRKFKIHIEPPNLNESHYKFTVLEDKIHYGLGAIKGVGEGAIENIVTQREANGPFQSLFDFCERVDLRKANKRVLEALVKSGAMDCFGKERSVLFASLQSVVAQAEQVTRDKMHGQLSLFSTEDLPKEADNYEENIAPWTDTERLNAEKESLGLYLSGHPFQAVAKELKSITTGILSDISCSREKSITVAGLIVGVRALLTKKAERMAFVSIDDGTGRMDIAVFSDLYQKHRAFLIKDEILVVTGIATPDEYSGGVKLRADKLYSLSSARQHFASALVLHWHIAKEAEQNKKMTALQKLLENTERGNCPIWIKYYLDGARALLKIPEKWNIDLTETLLEALQQQFGLEAIELDY